MSRRKLTFINLFVAVVAYEKPTILAQQNLYLLDRLTGEETTALGEFNFKTDQLKKHYHSPTHDPPPQ